jgi:glycosyltransferase involved in cell wall biosynthesis
MVTARVRRRSTPVKLSVVIPYYREPRWLPVALADLERAVASAALDEVEVLVVDDGSPEAAQDVVGDLACGLSIRILRQDNRGRFEARRAGIEAAAHDVVLLLDSRVSLRPTALAFAAGQVDTGAVVWNAHVDVDVDGNPFARFWNVLTEASYAHYFDAPRTTCFGLDDFDLYPKGTTCFLAPRASLLDAYAAFSSRYEDLRLSNDDTPIIRTLAERHGVCISPAFSCLYRSRDALRPFLRHAYHRGTVFVDGHAVRGGRFLPVIIAFYPATVLAAGLAARWPRLLSAAALVPAGGAALGVARGRPAADVGALAALAGPWLGVFGAGMWRGLWLSLRARAGTSRRPATPR